MKILGLDPSLSAFGWAVHETTATGPERCVARGRISSPSSMVFVDRYTGVREVLRGLVRHYAPQAVGIESPFCGGSYSEGMYGLFLYSNEALKLERSPVVYFTPLQIKSHARETLGRPETWKMMKPDMVEAARKDTDTRIAWDHNEADAYLAARLAGRFWDLYWGHREASSNTPVERKLFTAEHTYSRGKHAGETEKTGLLYREQDRFFPWSEVCLETTPGPVLKVSYPAPPKEKKKK